MAGLTHEQRTWLIAERDRARAEVEACEKMLAAFPGYVVMMTTEMIAPPIADKANKARRQ